jgi:phosphatidate cytidylyltransferase
MKRIVTGLILAGGWVMLLLYGPYFLFWVVVVTGGTAALSEYVGMMRIEDTLPARAAAIAACALPLFFSYSHDATLLNLSLLISFVAIAFYAIVRYSAMPEPFSFVTSMSTAMIMISFFGAHLCMIKSMHEGSMWLLYLTAITACSDTAAFYAGTYFGKRKLCPSVSPKKTWEGFAGGLMGGTAGATVTALFLLPSASSLHVAIASAFLVSIGVVGDLIESIVKRAAGFKDSGSFLPGHGGVLDRIDSLLVTAPFLYYLLQYGWFF